MGLSVDHEGQCADLGEQEDIVLPGKLGPHLGGLETKQLKRGIIRHKESL